MKPFSWPTRIYWEDTDAGGIVYYANYLKFMERARSEWLRSIGIEQNELLQQGFLFVVVDVEVHFHKPARFGELLQVTAGIGTFSRVSLTFDQQVLREQAGAEPQVLLTGKVRVACLDAVKFRPRPLPDIVLQEIGNDR